MAPKVLLHGVPETTAIWDRVIELLDTEVTTLALPGFAAPRPDRFAATMDEYASWLLDALEGFGEPVDLVGHDWGGILTARIATMEPPSLRTWVSDAPGALQPSFTWHDLALIWQTEGAGEEFWDSMMADRGASAELLAGFDIPLDDARVMTDALDDTMVASILALYRSAGGIGEQWAITGPVAVPGLVLVGANDPFGDPAGAEALAAEMGASFRAMPGAGHFWPVQAPAAGAAALTEFWSNSEA